jgi:hypothetical protein
MGSRQAMTGMDDVERQAIHGDPEIMERKNKAKRIFCTWCIQGIVVAMALCLIAAAIFHEDVEHYVAIDSVSGLDPARGLSFNLTLRVASWSINRACIIPGTYVEVSYNGVKLAASEAETGRLCAWPWKSAERRVAANAVAGVHLGQVLEGLTTEMKQGAAAFDVALHLPAGSYGRLGSYDGKSCVTECGGRRVGDATTWCNDPRQI